MKGERGSVKGGETGKCTGKRDMKTDSKEGESRLFLRQYCMSSGNAFYHFAACNMCSFPVSHSTNILVSFCLQHHGPTMRYPHVLSLPLSSHEPSPCACTCLQEGQWSQSHKSSDTYVFPVKWPAIFPHTQSGQRARLCGTASHPVSSLLPKVWPQEMHSSSKSIRDSSITETRVQTNAVFLEPSQSHSYSS